MSPHVAPVDLSPGPHQMASSPLRRGQTSFSPGNFLTRTWLHLTLGQGRLPAQSFPCCRADPCLPCPLTPPGLSSVPPADSTGLLSPQMIRGTIVLWFLRERVRERASANRGEGKTGVGVEGERIPSRIFSQCRACRGFQSHDPGSMTRAQIKSQKLND